MAAVTITPDDLAPFATIDEAKAQAMIDDALARAALIAPCIAEDDFDNEAAAKAIIRGAILRWNEAGTGAYSSQTTGPFSVTQDTRQERRSLFWPSEITDLEKLCASSTSGAFGIDTAPGAAEVHGETCALRFGATYCSCGVDIAGYPLYEILP